MKTTHVGIAIAAGMLAAIIFHNKVNSLPVLSTIHNTAASI
jgi:hypothetical protein